MSILHFRDMLAERAERRRELAFYLAQKETLEGRLNLIRHEIRLTDDILKMIKREIEKP